MQTFNPPNSHGWLLRLNRKICALLMLALMLTAHMGCEPDGKPISVSAGADAEKNVSVSDNFTSSTDARKSKFKALLSDYGLFQSPMSELEPADGVVEYELNTPLFSDYSQKQRLIRLPEGTSANYKSEGALDFPVGTVIAKTFYYAADLSGAADISSAEGDHPNRHLVETRIMEHQESGWIGIPYVWNEEQTDARLAIAGAAVDVAWKHTDGQDRINTHVVPNLNDCKRCHISAIMEPIGLQANNLNRDFAYDQGTKNQLLHWAEIGLLAGIPELVNVPRLAVWDDPSEDIDSRARAYLDVNCAHCHNKNGPARNSGLHLNVQETNAYHLGEFKTPVAAGKGTGGRLYGIVPGKPEQSIMEYRMQTIEPGEIMPEFGKSLVHEEGLALIRKWIAEMK